MRIIAGKFKGRKLTPPTGNHIRPTSDRTRESLFNLLMHGAYGGEAIVGQHVVDLCCGTGALGIEAISRGARKVTFIDNHKASLALAQANLVHCGEVHAGHFVQGDAAALPAANEPAALVLMDAPYDKPLLAAAYDSLRARGWLADGALLVAEQPGHAAAPVLDGAELVDERRYGKTVLLIYRVGEIAG